MIETYFVNYLLGVDESPTTDLAARIGNRLYPEILPQNSGLPAISYTRITSEHPENLDGSAGLAFGLFQISCWAETAKDVAEIAALVRARMIGLGGNGFQKAGIEDERSGYEPETQLYRQDVDVRIAYAASNPA